MNNDMLRNLIDIIKNSQDSKDNVNIDSLYSDIEKIMAMFQQPQQEINRNYEEKPEEKPVHPVMNSNFNPSLKEEKKELCRNCNIRELIRNGGFEITSSDPKQSFNNWLQTTDGVIISASNIAYEGELSVKFVSQDSENIKYKTASLYQNIPVKPGYYYELSFAENFFSHSSKTDSKVRLSARAYYGNPNNNVNQVDLINVDIYKPNYSVVCNKGYSFHKKNTEIAIPNNVSSITIEFKFQVSDLGGTDWRVDEVSVHPVASAIFCDSNYALE